MPDNIQGILNMRTRRSVLFVLALAVISMTALSVSRAGQAADKLRIFFVGNSLTDTISYKKFQTIVTAQGDQILWSRHTGPGATLDGLYKPDDKGVIYGIAEEPYGKSPDALTKFDWDVVTLQPFDRPLVVNDNGVDSGDIINVNEFLKIIAVKNKDAQVYLHGHWPRRFPWDQTVETAKPFDYSEHWTKPYSGGWESFKDNSFETRDFYEKLRDEVNKTSPLSKPVLIIPAGEVIYEIDQAARAGNIKGLKDANDLYTDGIHFGNKGAYLTAITFYSTIYKKPPTGISGKTYGFDDPEFEKLAQELVWKVVSTYPYAGIAK